MAKKTHLKVRMVPESNPNSKFIYYAKKPTKGENQLFQAATRIFGTMLVHPPLFGNTASKLPVKNCKFFFWPRLFFYVLPAKNSSCKTAVNDIQFCSK